MNKHKIKLAIIFGVEFLAIVVVLLLIFFAGKKSYTVTFDLNGGTLLSGEVVQEVMQGSNATPPVVARDGCYLHSWSASYRQITKDVTIRAIWEYESTVGIRYTPDISDPNGNEESDYYLISGSYEGLRGDVYIGAFHNEKQILGIQNDAFKDRVGIEHVFMLDGIISIGDSAFEGCSSLESIVLPGTLAVIGEGAFKNCTALKSVTIPASVEIVSESAFEGCTALEEVIFLSEKRTVEPEEGEDVKNSGKDDLPPETYDYSKTEIIGERAFMGCTALERVELPVMLSEICAEAFAGCESLVEIVLPESLEKIGVGAFDTPEMTINILISEQDKPEGWLEGWCAADAEQVWEYVAPDDAADGSLLPEQK